MTNKETMLYFYDRVFNNWDLSEIDTYVKENYIQHSAGVEDGREGFKKFIKAFIAKQPHTEMVKVLEDGDMVCMFFKCTFGDGTVAKVFDMFRLEDGMLAEHWDCPARIDNVTCVHNNGHF